MSIIETADKPPATRRKPPAKRSKEWRPPRKLGQALALLSSGRGMTQRAAAEQAGLSECYLSRQLRKDQVQAFLTRNARKTLATASWSAAQRVVQLMHAESERVSLAASTHVLSLEGIAPVQSPQFINQISIIPGYNVVLPQQPSPMHDIEHVTQDEAKPLKRLKGATDGSE